MTRSNSGSKYGRIGAITLWIPILLISAVYIVGMLLNQEGERDDLSDSIRFVMPFVVLFVLHHYLLLGLLYLRGHVRAYIVSAVLLLGVFGVFSYYNFRSDQAHHGPHSAEMSRPPHEGPGPHEKGPYGPGPHEKGPQGPGPRGKGPHGHHGKGHGPHGFPNPVTMDIILAVLLLGADLTMSICLKYASDRRHSAEIEREHLNVELD